MKVRDKLFREANFGNPNQKKLAKLSLFMTAADLCDGCKKWDDNLPTVVMPKFLLILLLYKLIEKK